MSVAPLQESLCRQTEKKVLMLSFSVQIGVMYGNPETTTGGQALKYYSSVRLDVRKTKNIDGPVAGEHVGVRVKAKVCF